MRISDWSSDVCSSDLLAPPDLNDRRAAVLGNRNLQAALALVDESLARHQVVRLTAVHPSRAAAGKAVDKQAASSAGVQSGAARAAPDLHLRREVPRSEEHTSELQSLMRNSYAVFC